MRIVCFLAALSLAACSNSTPVPPTNDDKLGQLIEFRRDPAAQYVRYSSGVQEPGAVVIRDANEWRRAWSIITAPFGEPPALPAVNFEREMVVFVALGTKNSGGYTAEILRVARSANGISVDWQAQSPGPRCGTTAALTHPIDFVIIPRVEGDASFTRHDLVTEC